MGRGLLGSLSLPGLFNMAAPGRRTYYRKTLGSTGVSLESQAEADLPGTSPGVTPPYSVGQSSHKLRSKQRRRLGGRVHVGVLLWS